MLSITTYLILFFFFYSSVVHGSSRLVSFKQYLIYTYLPRDDSHNPGAMTVSPARRSSSTRQVSSAEERKARRKAQTSIDTARRRERREALREQLAEARRLHGQKGGVASPESFSFVNDHGRTAAGGPVKLTDGEVSADEERVLDVGMNAGLDHISERDSGWEENLNVERSSIHGKGVFARRSIEEGEYVGWYDGELINNAECLNRDRNYQSANSSTYFFRVSENSVVDATFSGNMTRYINHSCSPNAYATICDYSSLLEVEFRAERRIAKGEEITFSYDLERSSEDAKELCCCASKGCKRYID